MTSIPAKLRILFLCAGNDCRSQMAEGWVRSLKADVIDASSAGLEAAGALDPRGVKCMAEAGIDISGQRRQPVTACQDTPFDYVITLCDRSQECCPPFPATVRVLNTRFADPQKLAARERTEDGRMQHYRRIRNEIRRFVEALPSALTE